MTEEEAKTRWCPFARVFVETDEHSEASPAAAVNRLEIAGSGEPDLEWPAPRCIGSDCMAWRWTNDYERRWDLPADNPPEGAGWQRVEAIGGVAHWARQTTTPHGFCGLAGTPQ